uniref:Uncharacterized protein n=1 Tax=Rhizophora mucronata TaxID=61149 RepID=A0A2P2IND6_RHIMU
MDMAIPALSSLKVLQRELLHLGMPFMLLTTLALVSLRDCMVTSLALMSWWTIWLNSVKRLKRELKLKGCPASYWGSPWVELLL